MQPNNYSERGEVMTRRQSTAKDDDAVSEILGVIMMLAMVITIMGGVWVFLNPYLVAFNDNTNWNSASNIADRVEDRIDVVGDSPDGTGTRQALSLKSSSINPANHVEEWVIASDLTPFEVVDVIELNASSFEFLALNESVTNIIVQSPTNISEFSVTSSFEWITIDHDLDSESFLIIDFYNAAGDQVHRWSRFSLSGISINTAIDGGMNQIALINGARISKDPSTSWSIEEAPRLRLDTLVDGSTRLSIVLTDIRLEETLGNGPNVGFKVESLGPIQLFTGESYNLKIKVTNTLHSVIDPQYHDTWLNDYTINRAAGTLGEFVGITPYQRASGSDGLTVETQGQALSLEIDVRRLVVNG
ncbi:MAG: hypothetical protein CMA41_03115 [Euryarchaeota archaeon]|jgi:hypothetical protein|nr:hypothetical protein [Euryarchaeota archaeon]|tara:strand:- start:1240 stop:2319 length:1080 start_codon:yes stop_codon:yes gene_type:complete